ncbi:hypothetical protein EXIGLDRAFT_728326 [Exidia glandulosa HHB12029]|uniref:Uncharacterized protein n=1 Tax=Exidia glandulosa HHB12029 TaxID=1314781 RepID=A0A165LTI9_EXIGL|nr:hypothetical protein EXIGLDRAFT_728326 [Exidia glandulosa HHB12029]
MLAFSHMRDLLASAHGRDGEASDRVINIWHKGTGRHIAGPLQLHTARITAMAFSPDDQWLLAGSADGEVVVCDVQGAVSRIDVFRILDLPNPPASVRN